MSTTFYFSPNDGSEAAIVNLINSAEYEITGCLYMYHSQPIHDSLLNALSNDIIVSLVFDRRQQYLATPRIFELTDAGAFNAWDKHEKSMRNQYLIIDQSILSTGSYLYTYTSDLIYAENLIITDLGIFINPYYNNYTYHYEHSEPIVVDYPS